MRRVSLFCRHRRWLSYHGCTAGCTMQFRAPARRNDFSSMYAGRNFTPLTCLCRNLTTGLAALTHSAEASGTNVPTANARRVRSRPHLGRPHGPCACTVHAAATAMLRYAVQKSGSGCPAPLICRRTAFGPDAPGCCEHVAAEAVSRARRCRARHARLADGCCLLTGLLCWLPRWLWVRGGTCKRQAGTVRHLNSRKNDKTSHLTAHLGRCCPCIHILIHHMQPQTPCISTGDTCIGTLQAVHS